MCIFSMANSRMAMGPAGHQAMMDQMSPVVEEEKKPKATKKRKKKKAETPVKKDDKAKVGGCDVFNAVSIFTTVFKSSKV